MEAIETSLNRKPQARQQGLLWILSAPFRLFVSFIRALREEPFVTSVEVAFMRALGVNDPSVKCPDTLAYRFLTLKYRLLLVLGSVARWLSERISPGAYGYHNARTKHFDAVIENEIANGVEQLVILGAGNDSRAYRMPGLRGVRVFEVDLARTQQRKQRLVEEICADASHVTFIPMDFEKDALDARLRDAGFDSTRKTLFSWEGVSMYLTKEAVNQVLTWIADLARAGGSVVFDYSLRSYTEGRDLDSYGGRKLARWLSDRGMKYVFGAERPEMASLVAARGFDPVSDVGPIELENQLLRGDVPAWRVWGNFRVVHARLRDAITKKPNDRSADGQQQA